LARSHVVPEESIRDLCTDRYVPPLILAMHATQLLFSVLWCIHGLLWIDGLKLVQISDTFEDLLDYPEGMDLSDVQDWLVEFDFNTPLDVFQAFCLPLDESICNPVTWGPSTLMIQVSAGMAELRSICSSYFTWIRVISPEFDIYLDPDDMVDSSIDFLQLQAATWGLNRIGADRKGGTGANSNIFVFDTGVRSSHREFGGRAASAIDMTKGCRGGDLSCALCNGDSNCAKDRQGHGTHCAGTAAGASYGVAPAASIFAVKVLSDAGSGSWSWSYGALAWLASIGRRPAIASMSLGWRGKFKAIQDAVDAAVARGVTVVVAAGNKKSDACNFSPAHVPSAITVGSTDSRNYRSSFSNYGSCIDIWAPGSWILSASHTSDTGSVPRWGTSMACPHVSGAAALVLAAEPGKSSSQVLTDLISTATMNVLADLRGSPNALLNVVGVGSSATSDCTDSKNSCRYWAGKGYCSTSSQYYQYMQQTCCKSCRPSGCTDSKDSCSSWKGKGYCSTSSQYHQYMHQNCCSSCRR